MTPEELKRKANKLIKELWEITFLIDIFEGRRIQRLLDRKYAQENINGEDN